MPILFEVILFCGSIFYFVQVELFWFHPVLFLNLILSQRNVLGRLRWIFAHFVPFDYSCLIGFIRCIFVRISVVALLGGRVEVGNWSAIVNACFWLVKVDAIVDNASLFPLLNQLVPRFRLLIERYHRLGGLFWDSFSFLGSLSLELCQTSFLT